MDIYIDISTYGHGHVAVMQDVTILGLEMFKIF
jgi:hypothetical protein